MGTRVPPSALGVAVAVGYPSGDAIRHARETQGWTMAEAVRMLKKRYGAGLPDTDSLIRSWKRWEKGTTPSRFYRPLLSDLLGFHPSDPRDGPASAAHPAAEIPLVFRDQAGAAAEIRSMAAQATSIDVLAVRGSACWRSTTHCCDLPWAAGLSLSSFAF